MPSIDIASKLDLALSVLGFATDRFGRSDDAGSKIDYVLNRLSRSDDVNWQEDKHPRDPEGKFTAGSGSAASPKALKSQMGSALTPMPWFGFKSQPGAEAYYKHPEGHEIYVKPPVEGKKSSNEWVHTFQGKTTTGNTQAQLESLLKQHLGEPAFKKSKTIEQKLSEAEQKLGLAPKPAKPAPEFKHWEPGYANLLAEEGAVPVKELTASQKYSVPSLGMNLAVSTKPTVYGSLKWSLAKDGKEIASGKGSNQLKNTLSGQKFLADPKPGPDTVKGPEGVEAKPSTSIYIYGSSVGTGPGFIYDIGGPQELKVTALVGSNDWQINGKEEGKFWTSKLASGKGQADLDAALAKIQGSVPVKVPEKFTDLGVSSNTDGFFEGNVKVKQLGQTSEGEAYLYTGTGAEANKWQVVDGDGKVLMEGSGQQTLDQAFEALHPRGPGGQFQKKAGGEELTPDKEVNDLLESVGATKGSAAEYGFDKFNLPNGLQLQIKPGVGSEFAYGVYSKQGSLLSIGYSVNELIDSLAKNNVEPTFSPKSESPTSKPAIKNHLPCQVWTAARF